MAIDRLILAIKAKKNPCIAGIDPEWDRIPECYKTAAASAPEAVLAWATDVIDAVCDIVPAVKPQMAFFEVYGAEGVRVHESVVRHARDRGLIVIDDSKRNDIGNTARAYAFAHLAKNGPINADFLTVSPFLGTDSLQPFIDTAVSDGKGLFVLVKTSNPSSAEISEAVNRRGEKISDWLAGYVNTAGGACIGESGYSGIGAVVGATFPEEAKSLRRIMRNNFFLVPGFGAQGGRAEDIAAFFNEDGLGAVINASRSILYSHQTRRDFDGTREMYARIVRAQADNMRLSIYGALKTAYPGMVY